MKNASAILLDNGIKPSYQRIRILEYLMTHRTHPTVAEVYNALIDEIPTLSKTTVYNTLKLLIDHEIVSEILIEEKEVLYDVAEEDHGHFKCVSCGALVDFDLIDAPPSVPEGFVVQSVHIYYKGLCDKCREKQNNA
ncbi:Fur family transcriptional regulator [Acidaminobacter hydrogenoformans]|uniref:Fur family transcriptional regulator, peroxide stress response regulator n=1 Tax=Acidaminobacter hydrogenoformans DSM 2784 TaxID=1120920 RepID=A0A1G5RW79_9FIRM|nr:Fur family transcriptional regulator [Acidaminobacter hydrogenoformans]SCZ78306.1 Fur family transcriptional regulator, peroxide stress response regulator [Acidaminobacter hydrogenoformans DSM 2784]